MDYARLRKFVEVVAESTSRLEEVVTELAEKAYEFIEYAEDYWDESEDADTGQVEEEPVDRETMIDYLYSKIKEYSPITREAYRAVVKDTPITTIKEIYEDFQRMDTQ